MPPALTKALDERLAKEAARNELARHAPLHARRGRGAARERGPVPSRESPPVIVADEPDPAKPDDWRIHAYFADQPTARGLRRAGHARRGRRPEIEQLGEDDWVTMSQAGLEPIRAGRFFVHTPTHRDPARGAINFEIDAGLAFGTGQHATTAGCLAALDRLERAGKSSPTSPTSAPAPGCSLSPRWRCGRGRKASPPTSTRSRSTSPRDNARDQRRAARPRRGRAAARGRRRHGPSACSPPARRSTCSSPTSSPGR